MELSLEREGWISDRNLTNYKDLGFSQKVNEMHEKLCEVTLLFVVLTINGSLYVIQLTSISFASK